MIENTSRTNVPVAEFWDEIYRDFDPTAEVTGKLDIPTTVGPLIGKDLLIVSCGTGRNVVRACRESANVTALDISPKAVENACAMAAHYGFTPRGIVTDGADTGLASSSFDLIWGDAVLHHLEHERAAPEFARLLRDGGSVVMMSEPTFFNPLLRLAYQTAFGKGRVGRRRKFLIFTRIGDEFEKPIEESDLDAWRRHFEVRQRPHGFMFFSKLGHVASRRPAVRSFFSNIDRLLVKLIPRLIRYSYEYDFVFVKR